jgi:hypothetical protein
MDEAIEGKGYKASRYEDCCYCVRAMDLPETDPRKYCSLLFALPDGEKVGDKMELDLEDPAYLAFLENGTNPDEEPNEEGERTGECPYLIDLSCRG